MRNCALALALLVVAKIGGAVEWQEDPRLAAVFAKHEASGTFVVYDAVANKFIGHDHDRAKTRFVPASTFKIANTLIGLSCGAVASVDEVIPFVGEPQTNKAWQHDMSLRQAIAISNVPLYQELARRIGLDAMRLGVATIRYGNGEIGKSVDTFWLQGPLLISADEQCRFLYRLATLNLPLAKKIQESVKQIVELDHGEGWTLYGKTGATSFYTPSLGWWVGWVRKDGVDYSFALNIDMPDFDQDLEKRTEIGLECLSLLGIIPGESDQSR